MKEVGIKICSIFLYYQFSQLLEENTFLHNVNSNILWFAGSAMIAYDGDET